MIINKMASEKKGELLSVYAEQAKIINKIAIWQYCEANTPFYRDHEKCSTLLAIKNNKAQDTSIQDTIENMYALTCMYITTVKNLVEQSPNHEGLWMQVKDLYELHENGCVPIYKEIIGKEKDLVDRVKGAVFSFFNDTELNYSTYDNFIRSWDDLYKEAVSEFAS
ncbi:MAG: hypothetical protein KAJ91_01400 [Candidatus Aenigmarchaeota archaeon]|nr:hypothetical protein [Candidatus Aenigmarchaeota archaeon]